MEFPLPGQKEPKNIKANVLTVASAVFLAAVALAAVRVWTGIGDRQAAPVTSRAPDTSALEWHDIASWESSGSSDSPSFHVSAETWRVTWSAAHDGVGDGSFAIHVYNPDGLFLLELYDTANTPGFDFDGPLHGTLGHLGPGDFLLRIKSARDYKITVQEPR